MLRRRGRRARPPQSALAGAGGRDYIATPAIQGPLWQAFLANGQPVEWHYFSDANHGFPSIDPDMYTVFCAEALAFPPRRHGPARTIDVAPTVAEWLGLGAMPTARGRSVLEEFGAP